MLPPNERLRKTSVFQRAYTGRKSVSTRLVTLYVVPRAKSERKPSNAEQVRMPFVGFVAAKKVLKSAVSRNRVKRRVREAYRLLTRSLREEPSQQKPKYRLGQWYVLVFVLHAVALEASWTEILNAIDECLNKAEHKFGVMKSGGEPGGKPRD